MIRPLVITAITIAAFIAALLITAWSTADTCVDRARSILAAADPLDRQPPQTVVDVVRSYIPVEHMPDLLASVLLDRYACRGNGIEWLVDRPALAWRLRTALSNNGLVALFASTANMDKGDIGLSRGARRLYHKEISLLGRYDIECLVRRALGKATFRRAWAPEEEIEGVWFCAGDGLPPIP